MNFAIAKTMLLEQFQRTLPILVLCLGISTVLCLLHYTGLWLERRVTGAHVSPDLELIGFTVFLAHAIGFLALLYCHCDERDMKVTMPTYLLRLPVRTIDLVIWRMGYGLFCVAVIGIGSSAVHYLLFGAEMESAFAFWTPCLIGVTTFAMFQALAWSVGAKGIVMLIFAIPIVLKLSDWLGFTFDHEPFDPSRYTTEIVLSLLAVSFLVAYVSVRTRRKEGFDISRLLSALPSKFTSDRGVDRPPFTSPEEAMRWFEWRRQGRMLPVLVLGGSIFLGISALASLEISSAQYPRSTMLAFYGELVAVMCYAALGLAATTLGAYCFFQNQRLQLGSLKTFLFIRPVSTKAIANARLDVVFRSVVVSMVPLVLACAVAVLLSARSTEPTGLTAIVDMGVGGVGVALLMFFGMLAAVWCVQWFGNLLALLSALGIGSLFLLAFIDFDSGRVEALLFWITAIVLFTASALLIYMARQRDLLENKSLYFALAAWPLLVLGFSMLLHWDHYINNGGSLYGLLLHNTSTVLTFAVLPLAPLATVPLVMQYARHR